MHQELPLLINITVALVVAFIGGVIARRIGLPTIVGYLVAGVAIGPFTPGFVGDIHTISQLAEIGVIFLMFGVGLHFSLRDLWQVRAIAIPGALLQMVLVTVLGLGLAYLWGWSAPAGLVLGLAVSIASTVVLLRGLMDHQLLETPHGQVAVGWLVLEDMATVLILVLLPALFGGEGSGGLQNMIVALLKAALFVVVMLFAGSRFLPWLLRRIVFTRSRELFILAVVTVALGTAVSAAEVFGVSLALGAFLAGVVLGESKESQQIGEDILPFRDIFAVLFFVSVGMLVNPATLLANAGHVLALMALIVVGKSLLTLLISFLLPGEGRTFLVVAAGLSQIGEFSFIVGQTGLALNVITQDQYGLILAGALLSITLNPLMFKLIPFAEGVLRRLPGVWKRMDRPVEWTS
jgi:monovalent cation:H+ antiporter-2, CPA2 family